MNTNAHLVVKENRMNSLLEQRKKNKIYEMQQASPYMAKSKK